MTQCVLLRLGWPSPKLNPNNYKGRAHWYNAKERAAAKAEGHGEALLRGIKNLNGEIYTLKVTAYPTVKRNRDDDNFLGSLKWHRDGIALAMGVDDSNFRWDFVGFEEGSDKPGVLIEVWAE